MRSCLSRHQPILVLLLAAVAIAPLSLSAANRQSVVDSLISRATMLLPVNLDSAASCAEKASELCHKRSSQKAAATNTLADIAFARMDYTTASLLYRSVLEQSGNRIEWLWADIGMMNICQRISDNMAFYQYRDKALLELRSIDDEMENLSEFDRHRVRSASRDLRLVSAIYMIMVEQKNQAVHELTLIEDDDELRADTVRYLRWNLLSGKDLIYGNERQSALGNRLRSLYSIYYLSAANNYLCQNAIALQGIARTLLEAGPEAMSELTPGMAQSLNPQNLGHSFLIRQLLLTALRQFLQYGSTFGSIETYCLLGSAANEQGEYEEALTWLSRALEMLNNARDVSVPGNNELPYLELFRFDDLIVENLWVSQIPLVAVPECMSSIREQISIAYSGLGDKLASDYNRNVYLELQKTIRLDRRFGARQLTLRRINRSLNIALIAVVLGIILLVAFTLVFSKAISGRNKQYVDVISRVFDLCGKILSVRPASGGTAHQCISQLLNDELAPLVGVDSIQIHTAPDGVVSLTGIGGLPVRDAHTIIDMVAPFAGASLQNHAIIENIGDSQRQIEKKHYLSLIHARENKRQNILRRASFSVVSDCMPLLDRMVDEASRLVSNDDGNARHLDYINELARRTEQYNAVLTEWLRMCQGEVQLHIESFQLQPLLDLISRSERSFSQKGISLTIGKSDAIVRADRVLTIFMLNTLAENARKFTPSGGKVEVQVLDGGKWVELSVTDNGIGLSQEDVRKLTSEKVYDPQRIGVADAGKAKGSGFGLMNCRGIIEKYRKSGEPFDCCQFKIESTLGKGSTFSFRLPKGVRRVLSLLLISFMSTGIEAQESDNALLETAYSYADSLYQSNLDEDHERALQFAEMAVTALNDDYRSITGDTGFSMSLLSDSVPAEQAWLEKGFATDYETILWIRNEVAVAALALDRKDLYKYNNSAYISLFRQFYSEDVIERDCLQLQRSNSNLRIAIVMLILLFSVFLISRLVIHSRHWLRYRSDMQQILRLTGNISSLLTDAAARGSHDTQELTNRLLAVIAPDLSLMMPVSSVYMLIESDGTCYSSHSGDVNGSLGRTAADCLAQQRNIVSEGGAMAFPLAVPFDEGHAVAGAFAVRLRGGGNQTDSMMCGMIAKYLAVSVHNCLLRLSSEYHNLEHLREQSERLAFEENRLHVQNMVIDNCLSTLKHETLSYPTRIVRLTERYRQEPMHADDVRDFRELTLYYRDIYDILSRNAARQFDEPVCKPERIDLKSILDDVSARFTKRTSVASNFLTLVVECQVAEARGDGMLLSLLLDNLLEQAAVNPAQGTLTLSAKPDGDFVRIILRDSRPGLKTDNLGVMFTPLWQPDNLRYVVCRQIIRELDDSMGHAGCRINAESDGSDNITIWLTIPCV